MNKLLRAGWKAEPPSPRGGGRAEAASAGKPEAFRKSGRQEPHCGPDQARFLTGGAYQCGLMRSLARGAGMESDVCPTRRILSSGLRH